MLQHEEHEIYYNPDSSVRYNFQKVCSRTKGTKNNTENQENTAVLEVIMKPIIYTFFNFLKILLTPKKRLIGQ